MKDSGGGGPIICTTSINAWFVEETHAVYNVTKAAVWALVRSAAIDLARPVTAPHADSNWHQFADTWEKRYPAIIRLWENAWPEFVLFLRFDREIRTVICTTNAIESINARLRRAVSARGHFLTEQAALKCMYLAIMSLDPTGRGRQRWTNRWKAALDAFDITFAGRLSAGRKQPKRSLRDTANGRMPKRCPECMPRHLDVTT